MGAPCGERHGRARLTENDVRRIRERYAEGGIPQMGLAEEYDVSPGTISALLSRRTWRHI